VAWQLRLHRRPDGHPLVDIGLFSSRRSTWGTILATLATFAMFGVFFVMPQFFQAVDGTDALGTGLMIASGYGVFAAGLLLGSFTSVGSGYGYVATWFALVGVGIGLALPAAMDAALGALSKERSGVGSALIQAVRQVGGAIGVAILGTVLNSTYRDSVDVTGLPAEAADTVKRGVTAGVAVATQLRSPELLAAVRRAFADAMDSMLLVSTGVALAGVVLALIFLPRRPEPAPVDDAAADLVAAESTTPDLVV